MLAVREHDAVRQIVDLILRKAGNAFSVFCGILKYRNKDLAEEILKAKTTMLTKPPSGIWLF